MADKPLEIIRFCPTCGGRNRTLIASGSPLAEPTPCRSCRQTLPLASTGPLSRERPVERCPVCGDAKLYVLKRFDQRLGCLVVALGAAMVPWTFGLSLAVCALIDLILYRRLPDATACYVCHSRMAGPPRHPDHLPYDLVSAQTWEARALHWRRSHDRTPQEGSA